MDKRVVVYWRGGVRWQKFSGWVVREGYKDVGQLHGGIATYSKDPEVQVSFGTVRYVFDGVSPLILIMLNAVVIRKRLV